MPELLPNPCPKAGPSPICLLSSPPSPCCLQLWCGLDLDHNKDEEVNF